MASDEQIARTIEAMASAGQRLAVHWGHQPWSDSWAHLVGDTLLAAALEVDDPRAEAASLLSQARGLLVAAAILPVPSEARLRDLADRISEFLAPEGG